MENILLKSKTREVTGRKVKKYRADGLVPAVLYGYKTNPKNLLVDMVDFKKVYDKAGENTIIEVEIDGKEKSNVLIHATQLDPISGKFSHIDFFQVRMDKKIEADVPIEFIGISPAVKELGGILIKSMEEVPVNCLPSDIPSKFELDLGVLKTFDDHIKVKDIKISDKVKITVDAETIVATVAPPRSDEEMSSLNEKVEEDVTKVEGVVKEEPKEEGAEEKKDKKEEK